MIEVIDERKRFRRFLMILAITAVFGALFVIEAIAEGADNDAVIASVMILVAIVMTTAFIARKKKKEMEDGIPSEDEMSAELKMRVGYLSFFVSVYFLMALGWVFSVYLEDSTTDVPSIGEMMLIAVAAMCIIFIVIWAAMSRGKELR